MKKKIVITGGTSRFALSLKKVKTSHKIFYPVKKKLNILNLNSIKNYIRKIKPDYFIHMAGLSRPMSIHDYDITKSIDLNIIGTANVVKACSLFKIKIIYFSTNYVYPGTDGNYKETDPVLPFNNYAWSKLGGECSVLLYKNSLILRLCMTEFPFVHKEAFAESINSFLYHRDVARIVFKVLDKHGILNIGGASQSVYKFAKKNNLNVKKIFLKNRTDVKMPKNSSVNINKLKKILKDD